MPALGMKVPVVENEKTGEERNLLDF